MDGILPLNFAISVGLILIVAVALQSLSLFKSTLKIKATMQYQLLLVCGYLLGLIITLKIFKATNDNKYTFIYMNTLIYWLMILSSVWVAKYVLQNSWYAPIVFVALFFVIEILYYSNILRVWDDNERVGVIYDIGFKLMPRESVLSDDTDLSEGFFDCDFKNTTIQQTLNKKYDKLYELMHLKPGQRVMDMGCGHGQWMRYLRNRGVHATGLTLSETQTAYLRSQGLDVHVVDYRQSLEKFYGKYDAITCISTYEHATKPWMGKDMKIDLFANMLSQNHNLFDPNSPNKRYAVTMISWDSRYKRNMLDYINTYLLQSTYSGNYVADYEFVDAITKTQQYDVKLVTVLTEDYRYVSVVNPNHFGSLDTFKAVFQNPMTVLYFLSLIFWDPFWLHRSLNALTNTWMWQFGGTTKEVIPNTVARPTKFDWYIFRSNTMSHDKNEKYAMKACNPIIF